MITAYYYYVSLDNYFVFDDFNEMLYGSGDLTSYIFGTANLRVFGSLIVWLRFKLFGLWHVGYNLLSIAVHLVNITAVFLLLKKISDNERFAFVASLIFAGMSVYCDAILYKAAFQTICNVPFYCLTLYLYLKGREDIRLYYVSLGLFFLGMFVKEEFASLPFMVLLLEIVIYNNIGQLKSIVKKIAPYLVIIVLYLAASFMQSKFNKIPQYEFEVASKFNWTRSLFGGLYTFFLQPDSAIGSTTLLLCSSILPVVLVGALYVSKNRRMLLFGLGWVIIAFLPQSYSASTSLNQEFIALSMSRHLYLPSIGAAIVIASIVLFTFRVINIYVGNAIIAGVVACIVLYNGQLVHKRSAQWGWNTQVVEMRLFLNSLLSEMPVFEEGAHLIVENPPAGRSAMNGALRTIYHNKVAYVDDPAKFDFNEIRSLYRIDNGIRFGRDVVVKKIK